ncbi:hypothetical protein ACSBR1_006196 [Camellia fascicularis]
MGYGSEMGTYPFPHMLCLGSHSHSHSQSHYLTVFSFSFSHSSEGNELRRICEGNDLAAAISVGVTTVVLQRASYHSFKNQPKSHTFGGFGIENLCREREELSLLNPLCCIRSSSPTWGLSSFLPMSVADMNNTIYPSGFPMQEFKPSLNFSLGGLENGYGRLQGVQETGSSARLFFPFEDLKQTPNTAGFEQNRGGLGGGGEGTSGYWTGMTTGFQLLKSMLMLLWR